MVNGGSRRSLLNKISIFFSEREGKLLKREISEKRANFGKENVSFFRLLFIGFYNCYPPTVYLN